MKKIILIPAIVFVAAGLCLTACTSQAVFKTVEADQAVNIAAKKNITVLDVRTAGEFAEGHLPNAINIDFLDPSFEGRIGNLDKKKKYLVYCRSGQRSTKAAAIMKEKGFKNVTNMLGGISQWRGQVIK